MLVYVHDWPPGWTSEINGDLNVILVVFLWLLCTFDLLKNIKGTMRFFKKANSAITCNGVIVQIQNPLELHYYVFL